jgi:hypothetical protein
MYQSKPPEFRMADAAECRRQASQYLEQSRTAETQQLSTALRNIAHSWTMLANQIERLATIEARRP